MLSVLLFNILHPQAGHVPKTSPHIDPIKESNFSYSYFRHVPSFLLLLFCCGVFASRQLLR